MNDTVGQNIQKLREQRSWTQEHLAAAAKVSPRTVQRIEDGSPASADTLLGLAAALDVTIDDLRRTPEENARLEAAAAEELKHIQERYEIVPLDRIERASRLTPSLGGSDALVMEHVDLNNDDEEDAVAEFEGCVRECLDFWGDMPECHRGTEKDLQRMIETLGVLGLVVAAGTSTRRLRAMSGKGEAVTFHVLYIVISRAAQPKLFVAIDKKVPVQFSA